MFHQKRKKKFFRGQIDPSGLGSIWPEFFFMSIELFYSFKMFGKKFGRILKLEKILGWFDPDFEVSVFTVFKVKQYWKEALILKK